MIRNLLILLNKNYYQIKIVSKFRIEKYGLQKSVLLGSKSCKK